MTRVLYCLGLLLYASFTVSSETREGIGEYRFGQNETKADACAIALEEAKRDALRKAFGEVVVLSRDSVCGDAISRETGNTCEIYERGFASINSRGFISAIEPFEPETSEEIGYEVCRVKTKFTIQKFEGEEDPTFEILDFQLSTGPLVRESDTPRIHLKTNRNAFHYVFMWAPDEDTDNYHLIYPNAVDPQQGASNTLEIPSQNRLKQYEFEVTLPADQSTSYEFLFLVSSKEPLEPPEIISQNNFQFWLLSLERDIWTQQKYNYRVIKGDSI